MWEHNFSIGIELILFLQSQWQLCSQIMDIWKLLSLIEGVMNTIQSAIKLAVIKYPLTDFTLQIHNIMYSLYLVTIYFTCRITLYSNYFHFKISMWCFFKGDRKHFCRIQLPLEWAWNIFFSMVLWITYFGPYLTWFSCSRVN